MKENTKNQHSLYKSTNLQLLKEHPLWEFLDDDYFVVQGIPKNLSHVSVNDSVFQINSVTNFCMGEALRFKEYERYGFVLINKSLREEDLQERLQQIQFNYANIKFLHKELEEHRFLVTEYHDQNQVFEDYFIAEKVLSRMLSYHGVEVEKVNEVIEGKSFLQKFEFMTLLLHKVFNYLISKQKFFRKKAKLFFLGPQMTLMKYSVDKTRLNQSDYEHWLLSKQLSDIKALKFEAFESELSKMEQQLMKAEQAIEDKVISRLRDRLKEDSNFTWPCFKCEKVFES